MKARELADFLMLTPEAEVRIASPLVGHIPYVMGPADISMNAEANCYIIDPMPRFEKPEGEQ